MDITPNQRFRHDGQTYEEGQTYTVPDELGLYFENVGWVGDDKQRAHRTHGTAASSLGLPITEPKETEMLAAELEKLIGNLRSRKETEVKLG